MERIATKIQSERIMLNLKINFDCKDEINLNHLMIFLSKELARIQYDHNLYEIQVSVSDRNIHDSDDNRLHYFILLEHKNNCTKRKQKYGWLIYNDKYGFYQKDNRK